MKQDCETYTVTLRPEPWPGGPTVTARLRIALKRLLWDHRFRHVAVRETTGEKPKTTTDAPW